MPMKTRNISVPGKVQRFRQSEWNEGRYEVWGYRKGVNRENTPIGECQREF